MVLDRGNFNPRSHERSDYIDCQVYKGVFNFNPRSHERSDLATWILRVFLIFQSTLPREERPIWDSCRPWRSDFNPRSHERSDHVPEKGKTFSGISIHAPTRGATRQTLSLTLEFFYFNPRSHERSDILPPLPASFQGRFQSTLPREERRLWTLLAVSCM